MSSLFNSYRIIIIILYISSAVFLSSCGDDDDDPVKPGNGNGNQQNDITFNGGSLNGQTLNLTGLGGGYSPSENITAVVLSGVSGQDTVRVIIAFPGSTTGTFEWQDLTVSGTGDESSGTILAFGETINEWYYSDGSAGATAVTTYGEVGQTITGTFSGNLISLTDSMSINGNFAVTRLPNGE